MNLYTFRDHLNNERRFVSLKTDVTVAGQQYLSYPIKRSKYSLDLFTNKKNNITVMIPGDATFARPYLSRPAGDLYVTIATMTGVPFYRGQLVTVTYSRQHTIDMTFEPLVKIGQVSMGERRVYQRNCPYSLYSENCQATRASHSVTIVAVPTTNQLRLRYVTNNPNNDRREEPANVLPTASDRDANKNIGRLLGGTVRVGQQTWWITNISDLGFASANVDFTITLFRVHGLTVNDIGKSAITDFGCNRTTAHCSDIHNNIENFGGFPGMVQISPFDGGLRG